MKCIQILASSDLGGGEFVGIHLSKGLVTQGIESEVWIPDDGAAYRESLEKGIKKSFYPLKQASSSKIPFAIMGNARFALQTIFSKSDLLHFHSPFIYRMLRLGTKRLPTRQVVHVHLESDEEGLKWALSDPPDVIVVCAAFLENYVRKCLPASKQSNQRIEVVSNAIDLNQFCPGNKNEARTKINVDLEIPLVLMVADLAPHKGQETAIKAIAKLRQEGITVTCCLVGRARKGMEGYESYLRTLVAELDLDERVYFAGHRSDVPILMKAADCLVLPSTREGLPLSIIEAQASGLPVIAAPTSGIPEVVQDGVTGFLVDAADEEGYAEKIKTILIDSKIRDVIISKAYEKCCLEHNWSSYIAKMIGIYKSIT